jgi:hypothetical protein
LSNFTITTGLPSPPGRPDSGLAPLLARTDEDTDNDSAPTTTKVRIFLML